MRRWLFLGMVVLITVLAGCNSKAEQARQAEQVRLQTRQNLEAMYIPAQRVQIVHIVE
jgi:uncharacterized protein YcfL